MPNVCAHTNTVRVLAYVKCTGCGEVWAQPGYGYDPNAVDGAGNSSTTPNGTDA